MLRISMLAIAAVLMGCEDRPQAAATTGRSADETVAVEPVSEGAERTEADSAEIREWEVPWADTRPRDPYVGTEGRVWFAGQRGNYIGLLEPRSGEFRRFELSDEALPHNVVVGPEGDLWYAGNGDAHIGRMDPEIGEIRRYDMPDPAARDPHTLIFSDRGDLWFTVQGGNLRTLPRGAPYGQRFRIESTQIYDLAGMLNLDPHDPTFGVQIDDHVRCYLPGIDARSIRQIDVQRVGICMIRELHLLPWGKPRSGNAVWTVSPSARVTTRRYLPSSST